MSRANCTLFVGSRDDRYLASGAHRGWDLRARRKIAGGDSVLGPHRPADDAPGEQVNDGGEQSKPFLPCIPTLQFH